VDRLLRLLAQPPAAGRSHCGARDRRGVRRDDGGVPRASGRGRSLRQPAADAIRSYRPQSDEGDVAMPARVFLAAVALLASLVLAIGWGAGQFIRAGAPALDVAGERWINSAPLTTPDLRGKVVLVEFWTFG